MLPIIVELLKYIAEKNKVKYTTGMEKRDVAPNEQIATALAMKDLKEEEGQPVEQPMEEEPVEEPQPRGLMARSM
jgi:hypothetical protein